MVCQFRHGEHDGDNLKSSHAEPQPGISVQKFKPFKPKKGGGIFFFGCGGGGGASQ